MGASKRVSAASFGLVFFLIVLQLGVGFAQSGGENVGSIISKAFFDGLLSGASNGCQGKTFYTYDAFVKAANAYSGFGTSGCTDIRKRELAAFFGNVMHETREFRTMAMCERQELLWARASATKLNYGAAGKNIGFDGINNPEKVGQDVTISFKTAVWFWMQNCHQAITTGQGFGATIRATNGQECKGGNTGEVNSRVNYYRKVCGQLGVDPGANSSC
eukprot:Gb_20765 [translate_table: standard]